MLETLVSLLSECKGWLQAYALEDWADEYLEGEDRVVFDELLSAYRQEVSRSWHQKGQ